MSLLPEVKVSAAELVTAPPVKSRLKIVMPVVNFAEPQPMVTLKVFVPSFG
jgi:hypothetical protein